MTHIYELIDQNILLYEARLKHIDEFYEKAQQLIPNHPDIDIETQLAPISVARESLTNLITSAKADVIEKNTADAALNQHSLLWQEITMELERLLKPFEALLPIVQTTSKND